MRMCVELWLYLYVNYCTAATATVVICIIGLLVAVVIGPRHPPRMRILTNPTENTSAASTVTSSHVHSSSCIKYFEQKI